MTTKKEIALTQMNKEFEVYSNLLMKQLRLLENIIDSDLGASVEPLFDEIKKNEKELNQFEVKISDSVINNIVLYNPVATELRQLMSIYRISLNMEKIGDLVINVLRSIKKADEAKIVSNFADTIGDIYIISINMVEKALFSYTNSDMDFAVWTIKNDDMVDELHDAFIKKIIKKKIPNVKSQAELKTFVNLMNIVSNIERIADNATNIAEAAIYASVGKDVRHKNINIDTIA